MESSFSQSGSKGHTGRREDDARKQRPEKRQVQWELAVHLELPLEWAELQIGTTEHGVTSTRSLVEVCMYICMIQICDVFTGIYDMYGMYAGTGSFCYDALRRSNKSNCEKRKDEI